MRIALVNPPFSKIVYGSEYAIKSITPCLGLFYLQAYCRDVADVEVFEGEFYADMNALVAGIRDYRPDVLGVTTNTTTYPLCAQLARELPEVPLKIAGGPYSSFRVGTSLDDFDAVFVGDSEIPLRLLAEGTALDTLPGVGIRREGVVTHKPAAPLLPLDRIPMPDHSRMRLGLYQASPHRVLPPPFATMVTTRGCGFACTFCLSAAGGTNDGRYRERSVSNVAEELHVLTEKHGVRSVQFWDDTFTMRKARTREMTAMLKQFDIAYVCNTRTDRMDAETAQLLADSGCRGVFFGVESGDQGILDGDIHKGVVNQQVTTAVAAARAAGLEVTTSFIFGSIDDTAETITHTIDFAVALDAEYVLFNIYTAHPGTQGYRRAVAEGVIDEYSVDLERFQGEPAGVPTVCRALPRAALHRLKASAYVRYYSQRAPEAYASLIETYRQELRELGAS